MQICVIIFLPDVLSAGVGIKNLVLIIFANFSAAAFLVQVLLYLFRGSLTARQIVDQAYRWVGGWADGRARAWAVGAGLVHYRQKCIVAWGPWARC